MDKLTTVVRINLEVELAGDLPKLAKSALDNLAWEVKEKLLKLLCDAPFKAEGMEVESVGDELIDAYQID
jgi:hypothetical protein